MKCPVCQSEKTCAHKTGGLLGIVLLVLVGGYFLLRSASQAPTETLPTSVTPETKEAVTSPAGEEIGGEVREITVSGSEFSFNPSSIDLKKGERVKINFKNTGQAPHNLTIEGLGIATKVIARGQSDTMEFTVPSSGTYSFYCSVADHRSRGMEGKLKVK